MPVDSKRRLGGATTATAGAPSAGAATQGAAQPAAQKQVGTGYVNLSDVLAANQSGAQAMGNALATSVQQQGQQAKQAIQGAQSAFTAKVKEGTPTYSEEGLQSVSQIRSRAGQGYTGPRTWAEVGGINGEALAGQAAQAQDKAKALTTQGGRAALLREQSPGLTAGGASLDAFLAGAGMGGRGQQIAADYGNLSDILADARDGTEAEVAAAEQQTKDAAQQYRTLEERWNAEDMRRQLNPAPDPEDIAAQHRRQRTPGRRDTTDYRSP